jgi:hypothetical protein
MNREDKKVLKAIRKMSKARSSEDVFHPHYLTIDGLSEKVGHPEYAQQVKNRVWKKMDEDEKYMDYTMIDFNHPDDLCITAEGVTAFFDILSGYFDPEALIDVVKYMQRLDQIDKNELKIRQTKKQLKLAIKEWPTDGLKTYITEFKASGTMCGEKVDDEICSWMEKELASRKPLHLFRRRKPQTV